MSIKQLWKSFTGTDHVRKAAESMVGKDKRPDETEEEHQRRKNASSTSSGATTSIGSF